MTPASPMSVVQRFHRAVNQHDLEAFVACFASDYDSKQPAHPDRAFIGNEQVRKNWSALFQNIPNLQANLLDSALSGNRIWTEWDWQGTRVDGSAFHMAGVVIMNIRDDRIASAQLYMEPVDAQGGAIDANVGTMTNKPTP
jgi:hypothetical protein